MNAGVSPSRVARRTAGVRRQAILVLGMHRSGTSAVTRCLNLLGADLGSRLMPAAEGNNSKGFWESMVAVEIHEKLLGNLDRSWNDGRPLPEGWLASGAAGEAREQIAELIRNEFGDSCLWAVKDPRLCRFVPLWRAALAEQGIDASALLVVRHPQEVARSLADRDGLAMELAWLMWLQHFAEAESESRGLPRTIIGYDELLSNWRMELTTAGHDLAITWPVSIAGASAAIDSFLDRGERHHEATESPGSMPPALTRLYDLCASRGSKGTNWTAISRLVDNYMELAPAFEGRAELLVENVRAVKQQGMDMESEARESLAIIEELTSRVQAARQLGTSLEDGATLYWRASDSEFSETRSRTVPVKWEASSEVELRFEVSAGSGIAALRFDPSGRGGAFNVSVLQLDGVAIEDLRGSVRRVNQYILDRQGGDGVWFASNDGDPWVEIDVSKLIRQGESLIIDIHCTKRMLDNVMGALIASIAGEMEQRIQSNVAGSLESVTQRLSSIHDGLVNRVETLRVRGAALEQELATGREREDALQARHAELEGEVAAAREREGALQARHAELEREVATGGEREARFRQEAFWLAGTTAELRATLDAEQRALGKAHDALDGKQSELEAMQARLVGLRRTHAMAKGELAEIKSSTIWRSFLLLRSLLLHVPRGIRLALRRMLKAGWWLITPWRIPARIRFLRHRRESPYSPQQDSGPARADTAQLENSSASNDRE